MIPFLILIVLIVIALAVLATFKAKSAGRPGDGPLPYYARKPLSPVEQNLYYSLCKALPDRIILAQVGLSRLLGVKKGENHQSWSNRISQMSTDFVICSKDFTIQAVIELDDASHDSQRRRAADEKKDKALAAAGIRVIRWQARSLPDEKAILTALCPPQPVTAPSGG